MGCVMLLIPHCLDSRLIEDGQLLRRVSNPRTSGVWDIALIQVYSHVSFSFTCTFLVVIYRLCHYRG
jgi:hypothetical protein